MGADLLDEERVSRGLAADALHERSRSLQGARRLDQLADLSLAQAGQRDLVGQPVVAQVRERAGEGMVVADLSHAVRPEDQQWRGGGASRQVAQKRDRGAVGPMEVVEDQ